MAAGFKGNVGGCAARQIAGLGQRVYFGMAFTGPHMPAFADDPAVSNQHAADPRVGFGGVDTPLGEHQCPAHPLPVSRAPLRHRIRPDRAEPDARSLHGTD